MVNPALINARRSDEAQRAAGDRLAFVVQSAVGVEGAGLVVLVGRDGTPSWQVLRVVAVAADPLTDAPEPMPRRDAVGAIAPRPMLIIAGRGEIDAIQAMAAAAAPASVNVWTLPSTPHIGGLDEQPAQWSERVASFLDRALDPSAAETSGGSG